LNIAAITQNATSASLPASSSAGQTLEEFLVLNDAAAVRARDLRRHDAIQTRIEKCLEEAGYAYTPVPMEGPSAADTVSPAELARTVGYGVAAGYLEPGKPMADAIPADPNVAYIEALSPSDHSRYLDLHGRCSNEAYESINAPLNAALAAVEPIMVATNQRLADDQGSRSAMNDWSTCIRKATGIEASTHDEFKAKVFEKLVPRAQSLASAGDTAGLRRLQQEEIRMATGSSDCERARRERVAPLVRAYESAMLSAHPKEFAAYLRALNGE